MRSRRAARAVATGLLWLASAAVLPQSRETLETRVSQDGARILLRWSKKHPWDSLLASRGAAMVVEYRTASGVGVDCLSGAPSRARGAGCAGIPGTPAGERALAFPLPESVSAQPAGPICLHIRTGDQRILPIRRAAAGQDTARFQAEAWARAAAAQARIASLATEAEARKQAIARQMASIETHRRGNAGKGWDSEAACEAASGGTVQVSQDRPVAPPPQQPEIARTLCIQRLHTAAAGLDGLLQQLVNRGIPSGRAALLAVLSSRAALPPPRLDAVIENAHKDDRDAWEAVRGAERRRALEDWRRFEPRLQEYRRRFPTPHFEGSSPVLSLQSLTRLAGQRASEAIRAGKDPASHDLLGFAGANLEAYTRCVADGLEQLALNYNQSLQWKETLAGLQPRLDEAARQECRDSVRRLSTMRQRLEQLQAELARIEQQARELAVPPWSSHGQDLNAAACSP